MDWTWKVAPLVLLAASGCAAPSANLGDARRPTLAILPVENDSWPKLTSALNLALNTVPVSSQVEVRRLKVAVQVVQLQIECLETTDACFTAVGKSLEVTRLLTAQLGKDPKGKGVRVTVVLFDVARGSPIKVADRVFKNEDEAVKSVQLLVAEAVAQRPDEASVVN